MTYFSVRLEAPNNSESNESDLERTYAIDTTIYIVNRLFRMHQDVLERTWRCFESAQNKKKEHQTICIVEFSYGKKAPNSNETGDASSLPIMQFES